MNILVDSLPFLTPQLPGIGGVLKHRPEDFVVEEEPAYLPSGQGEHLFLWIEKRDASAEFLTRHLSRALNISTREVGMAGLKDRQAVTRQFVSVPVSCEDLLDQIDSQNFKVLDVQRHGNKLKTGHLRANRFSILLRDPDLDAESRAAEIAEIVNRSGFANYYGPQRFGIGGETLSTGMSLLRGETTSRDLPGAKRKFLLRLALAAAQAHLFNQVLAARINEHLVYKVLPGDVMQVVLSGGIFVSEDAQVDQARFDAHEIMTTGPMFGPKMRAPQGEPALREADVLQQSGVPATAFGHFKKLTAGTRRPMLIYPQDFKITPESHGLRFNFTLPPGSYATSLLREFIKPAGEEGNEEA